jgi:hypothetical protein
MKFYCSFEIGEEPEKIKKTQILRLFNIFWDRKNLPLIPPGIDFNQSKTQKIIKSLENKGTLGEFQSKLLGL